MLAPKKILALLALALMSSGALAQQIRITSGEKWYGIDSDTTITIDSQNKLGHPSFLISNKGRYIYSQEPFEATISDKEITLNKNIRAQDGGKTLREAYLYCYHRNLHTSNAQIASELYTQPIYDMRGKDQYLSLGGNIVAAADKILSEGWPTGIILLGDDWQTNLGSHTLDTQYYQGILRQIQDLHQKGFKVIISITPYVSASGRIFNTYQKENMLLVDPKTKQPIVVATKGHGHAAIYNINAPGAKDHLAEHVKELLEVCKVDGIFTDSGMAANNNINSDSEAFIDSWNSLCEPFPLELNIKSAHAGHFEPALSGYSYEQISSPEYFLQSYLNKGFMSSTFTSQALRCGHGVEDLSQAARYLQNTALSAMFIVPFLPDQIADEQLRANCKKIIDARTNLSSYILESIEESLLTGEPLVRSLDYMYPRQGFYDCPDQYMLGSRYLVVAPNGDKTSRTVRFPRGNWYSTSGERIKGPVVRSINIKDGELLYFSNHR